MTGPHASPLSPSHLGEWRAPGGLPSHGRTMDGPGGMGSGAVSCVAERHPVLSLLSRLVSSMESRPVVPTVWLRQLRGSVVQAHSCPQQAGLWATGGSFSLAFIQGLPSSFLSEIALSSLLQILCFIILFPLRSSHPHFQIIFIFSPQFKTILLEGSPPRFLHWKVPPSHPIPLLHISLHPMAPHYGWVSAP